MLITILLLVLLQVSLQVHELLTRAQQRRQWQTLEQERTARLADGGHPCGEVALYTTAGEFVRREQVRMRDIGAEFPIPPRAVRTRDEGRVYRLRGKDKSGLWMFVEGGRTSTNASGEAA